MPFLYYIQFDLDIDQKEGCYVGATGQAKSLNDMYSQTERWERIVTRRCHVVSATRWSWKVATFIKAQRLETFLAGADMFDEDSTDCRWFTVDNVPDVSAMKKLMEPAKCVESLCDFAKRYDDTPQDVIYEAVEEVSDDEAFEKSQAKNDEAFEKSQAKDSNDEAFEKSFF